MGSIGDPWDNALAESFFASLEKELLRRERFQTREQARLRIFWYIECFYNPRRRHSSLDILSPIDYEQRHQQEPIAARCQQKRVISISTVAPCRRSRRT
jgi:putative transposase